MPEREHINFSQYQEDQTNLDTVVEDFRQAVSEFDSHQREVIMFGEWSLKDVISHF